MHPILGPGIILFLIIFIAYYWSFNKLYKIVLSEKPEWLRYKGESSIFYSGFPRATDPNVALRVLSIAFTGNANQLTSKDALWHAKAIRFHLISGLVVFGSILAFIYIYKASIF